MSDEMYFDVPIPDDLTTILAIHDGKQWIRNVMPETVRVDQGVISFTSRWGRNDRRRFTIATDIVGGYQCRG